MSFTWNDDNSPDEEAFATIRSAIDAGVNLLDAGQFYGPTSNAHANLKLVKRYFDQYPEDKEKVLLCVKGGVKIFGPGSYSEKGPMGMGPLTDRDALRETIQQIRDELGSDKGGKDIDMWEPARFPPKVDVGEMVQTYIALRDEGLFKDLSLSEVSGKTIEAAVSASKNSISAVEIEYSPFCLEAEEQGVLAACEKHRIPILAYSPVGKGFLTGSLKSRADLPAGDPRLHQERFDEENFQHNVDLANKLTSLAQKKGVTPSQLTLAWILQRSPVLTVIPGTRRAHRSKENAEASHVKLSEHEVKEIDDVLASFQPKGGRYSAVARAHQNLWA